jgi:membrane fusion protein (multidrug efflux system)
VLAFDPSEYQQRLEAQRADLDAARTGIERDRARLASARAKDELDLAEVEARLRKAKLLAAQPADLRPSIDVMKAELDLELAELEVELVKRRIEASRRASREETGVLEAMLRSAEANVKKTEDSIRSMTRTAPRAGIVVHSSNWRNEKRKVGDTVSVRDIVLEIPDLSKMEADGEVEEALAGRVRAGQPVTLRLDAYPDHEYRGTVQSISRAVQEKSWRNPLKVVRLKLSLDETDPERMRPGMRFRGEIEVERLPEVNQIPVEAVHRSGDTTVAYQRVLAGWRLVEVTLGRRNRDRVEVRGGLVEGSLVSLEPRP